MDKILICVVLLFIFFNIFAYCQPDGRTCVKGRKEFKNIKREDDILFLTKNGKMKYVDIYKDFVVAYVKPNVVQSILNLQRKARKLKVDSALSTILKNGKNYVQYEKCIPMTSSNIPDDYEDVLNKLKIITELGVSDFIPDNIMICNNKMKLTDQDPNTFVANHVDRFKSFSKYCDNLYKKKKLSE